MTEARPRARAAVLIPVVLFAAIGVLAIASSRSPAATAGIVALALAGIVKALAGGWRGEIAASAETAPLADPVQPGPAESLAAPPAEEGKQEPVARVRQETAMRVAVHGATRDLRQVLAGIISDEGGKPALDGDSIGALFSGRRHASRAAHAARRLISNVDALSASLEREMRIFAGVAADPEEAARLQIAAVELRVAALFTAGVVERLGDEAGLLAVVTETPEPLFGFVPVQARLPGL